MRKSFGWLQIQMVALEILPLIPAHKLANLMTPEGDFSSTITRQMSTSLKEVSAVAVASVGRWLSDPVVTDILALSQNIRTTARTWGGIIANATLDPSQVLAAAAFDAVRYLLKSLVSFLRAKAISPALQYDRHTEAFASPDKQLTLRNRIVFLRPEADGVHVMIRISRAICVENARGSL